MPTGLDVGIGPARELDLAIAIADLSGYTALTETHGALKASELVLRFSRLVAASLEAEVRLLNSVGDDVLFSGASATAVVRSALRLRDAVAREPEFPRVRTGLHHGAVIEREGRYFGAPINLAARLSDAAQGGQILCTAPIAEAVRALSTVETRYLGARHFRNVRDPVDVFELVRSTERRLASVLDPVCRMQVATDRAAATFRFGGQQFWFCSHECARSFSEAPAQYLAPDSGSRLR